MTAIWTFLARSVIPQRPAGEWDPVGAVAVLGPLLLLALIVMVRSATRTMRSADRHRSGSPSARHPKAA